MNTNYFTYIYYLLNFHKYSKIQFFKITIIIQLPMRRLLKKSIKNKISIALQRIFSSKNKYQNALIDSETWSEATLPCF